MPPFPLLLVVARMSGLLERPIHDSVPNESGNSQLHRPRPTAIAPAPYRALRQWIQRGALTTGAMLVLAALVAEAQPESDTAFSNVPRLARLTRSSERTTRRRLSALTGLRAICQTQRGTRYRMSAWRICEPPGV